MNLLPHNLYVVDDDEAVRRSLGLLLLARGYPVQAFASGEAFLAGADVQRAGCAILDLRLGGMSGLEVFEALRVQSSPLVVLFLSGHGEIPLAVGAVQDGAFGWLEKPCNDERLLAVIAQALEKSASISAQSQARQAAQELWGRLTPREMQIARRVAEGTPNKRIALDLA
ncbi:MAG: response regulator transcription factor, partial [Burkholderiaceae bacterium]|nr:response regulator transcription factor [Burkholderiaceae bacterium]